MVYTDCVRPCFPFAMGEVAVASGFDVEKVMIVFRTDVPISLLPCVDCVKVGALFVLNASKDNTVRAVDARLKKALGCLPSCVDRYVD